MRRFLSLFTVLMLCGVLAFAQSRVVTGTVTDNSGKPISFASVTIKGTRTGVTTDANGEYRINVKSGDVLVISQLSYDPIEIPVASMSNISTSLQIKTNTIKEVIVTGAFQTKRAQRSQSSNVQNVSAEQLNTVRAADVNNALAGKVAGAQVRSQSGVKLGEAAVVRLRGENGLGAGSGPIYVVDGTIIPASNDINTDDIEDITVLQGPAAAALFGPDGSNGAIVINTKRARKGQSGMGIEINSGVTFDKVYITPNYQNAYAGGADYDMTMYKYKAGDPIGWKALDGKYYHDESDDASWGPRIAGQEYIPWYAWYGGTDYSFKTIKLQAHPDNVKDFYNTGITKTNNVSFSKAGDNYNFRVSYTNLDQKGLIPNEYMKRNTLNTNFSLDLTSKLTFAASINYINQKRNAESNDGYANQSSGSFNQWFHRDNDMAIMKELRGLKTPEGIYASWNHQNPGSYDPNNPVKFYGGNYWFNYYTYFDLVQNPDTRDRLYGDVSLRYKITNDLSIKGTYRKQQLNTDGYSIYPTEMQNSSTQAGFNPYDASGNAAYGTFTSLSNRQNYELLLSYSKKIRDFAINANAGYDELKARSRNYAANTVGGLSVPGLYSLGNSKNPITNFGSPTLETVSNYLRRALFVHADFGYKNYAFIEGTYRRDYISTEPQGHYIDTKSIGASFVFSDFIKSKSILSYGKIRGSYGQILNSLNVYQLGTYYIPGSSLTTGSGPKLVESEPDALVSPTLQGAVNSEKEIGIETRWLKNRIGLSVTYWDRTNKNFPVNVNVPGQTGYTNISTDAGKIAKTGIDIQFNATPVKMKNFQWDISATWGRLIKDEVVAITDQIPRLVTAAGAFSGTSSAYTVSAAGQPWGQMFGGGIKRDSITGQPLLTPDGLFIRQDATNFGSVLPDYTGGVQNTFTLFKNFVININIDYQHGGKFFSLSDFWGTFSGLTARTAVLNDKGNSVRDAVADGGGVHVSGIDAATGKAIDYYVDAQTYFHQFRNANIAENSIYDLSFVKIREFSLGYKLPVDRMGISRYIKNATFSVIARNPYLLWSKTKDFDPSEISAVQGEDGQFPGTRSIGVNLKLGF